MAADPVCRRPHSPLSPRRLAPHSGLSAPTPRAAILWLPIPPRLPSSGPAVQVAGLGTPGSAQPGCALALGGVECPQLLRHPFPTSSLEVRVLLQLSYLALSLSPGHPTRLLYRPRPHSSVFLDTSGEPYPGYTFTAKEGWLWKSLLSHARKKRNFLK